MSATDTQNIPAELNDISALLSIMATLRDPESGCPWDVEQDFASIAPYTIEEAYEVADAIERHDLGDLCDELGDLLLQVVFHARMAEEAGAFTFSDVVRGICAKMIRRHPHVFADGSEDTAKTLKSNWEDIKRAERDAKAARGRDRDAAGTLSDVPRALPALARAQKLQSRAARVGFDWPDKDPVLDKIEEELTEFLQAARTVDKEMAGEEYGDLLFSIVNFGRHMGMDAETALSACNAKFIRRFQAVEQRLADQGLSPERATLDQMDREWDLVKISERN